MSGLEFTLASLTLLKEFFDLLGKAKGTRTSIRNIEVELVNIKRSIESEGAELKEEIRKVVEALERGFDKMQTQERHLAIGKDQRLSPFAKQVLKEVEFYIFHPNDLETVMKFFDKHRQATEAKNCFLTLVFAMQTGWLDFTPRINYMQPFSKEVIEEHQVDVEHTEQRTRQSENVVCVPLEEVDPVDCFAGLTMSLIGPIWWPMVFFGLLGEEAVDTALIGNDPPASPGSYTVWPCPPFPYFCYEWKYDYAEEIYWTTVTVQEMVRDVKYELPDFKISNAKSTAITLEELKVIREYMTGFLQFAMHY